MRPRNLQSLEFSPSDSKLHLASKQNKPMVCPRAPQGIHPGRQLQMRLASYCWGGERVCWFLVLDFAFHSAPMGHAGRVSPSFFLVIPFSKQTRERLLFSLDSRTFWCYLDAEGHLQYGSLEPSLL